MSATERTTTRVTVTAVGLSDMGRVRGNNEDAFLVAHLVARSEAQGAAFDATRSPVLLAVSDGMGGANAGEVASAMVIESLQRTMLERATNDPPDDWEAALKTSVEQANRDVWRAAREPGRRGMGATLTAVCVHGDEAVIAEVGDSRAYLVRGSKIRQVTRDQSFVQVLVDSGALKPEEAAKNPMKNVVLQAMGQTQQVAVAIGRLDLRRGDRLLVCSDGLSNKLEDDTICKLVSGPLPLHQIAQQLIDEANEAGGEDNITVVLAEIAGEGVAERQPVEGVTQTLHVISEYSGSQHRVEEDDTEDAPAIGGHEDAEKGSAEAPSPVHPRGESESPEIRLEALDAESVLEARPARKNLAATWYSSLLAVLVGVVLALLVLWLFSTAR